MAQKGTPVSVLANHHGLKIAYAWCNVAHHRVRWCGIIWCDIMGIYII